MYTEDREYGGKNFKKTGSKMKLLSDTVTTSQSMILKKRDVFCLVPWFKKYLFLY